MRLSTDALPARDRVALFQDEFGRRLTGSDVSASSNPRNPFRIRWSHVTGRRVGVTLADNAGFTLRRRDRRLRDGDDDFSYLMAVSGSVRWEQGDRRFVLLPGQGALVCHATPHESWWTGSRIAAIRVPRSCLPDPGAADRAAGNRWESTHPLLKLLRAYRRSLWDEVEAHGELPAPSERNLIDLVAALAATSAETARRTVRHALGPARVAAMREVLVRRCADPDLGMAEVAAAVGVSERAGHLAFAAAGLRFGDCLAEARLARVLARLRSGEAGRIIDIAFAAGFGDVSHFNRLFRRRFGMTPGEMRHG